MKTVDEIFGIETKDKELFNIALTHSSYTKANDLDHTKCYERLEFLGDAVLKLTVSDILLKKYPNYTEGQMSNIRSFVVSDNTLAQLSIENGLNKLIVLSKDAQKQGGQKIPSVIACAFEAVLGAYYLEGKYLEVLKYIETTFTPIIDEIESNLGKLNAKAILQEYTQGLTKDRPVYEIIEETGPDHKKSFTVAVSYEGKILAKGKGKTKKEAEQQSAYKACEKLGLVGEPKL